MLSATAFKLPDRLDELVGDVDLTTLAPATGDILYRGASKWQNLPKGSDGKVLTLSGGLPSWQSLPPDVGFANPMTTAGDLIVGGASGMAGRLGVGAAGTILVGGTTPAWSASPSIDGPVTIGKASAAGALVFTPDSSTEGQITFNSIAGEAPARFMLASAVFNGVRDEILRWGHNLSGSGGYADTTKALMGQQFEYHYYDGVNHGMEWNFDIATDGGVSGFGVRPLAFYCKRTATGSSDSQMYWSYKIGALSGSYFGVFGPSGTEYWRVDYDGSFLQSDPSGNGVSAKSVLSRGGGFSRQTITLSAFSGDVGAYVFNSGRVGISTSTPAYALDCNGSSGFRGAMNLLGSTSTLSMVDGNYLTFGTTGSAVPSFTTRSAGSKVVLYEALSGSAADYAFGINTSGSAMWIGLPTTGHHLYLYGGTTQSARWDGNGKLSLGSIGQNGMLTVFSLTASDVTCNLSAAGSQTADILQAMDSGGNILSRFNKAGYFMTRKNAAPANGDLASSEMALWLDATNGAGKLMVKAKTADGTVVTGSLALA